MKYIRLIGVIALMLVAALVGLAGPASAADCGQPAKAAVYETVTTPAVDEVRAPDVKVIDIPAQAAIPGTPGSPAVEEVSHIEHRLVTPAVDAYDEVVTPSQWWNWSPNQSQGPQDYEPAFPVDERGTWQGPHTEGGPDGEGTFNVSHGNSGNSSWFHRNPAVVIHHDEVPAVYEDVKVIDVEAKPAIPATPDIPAVEEVSHMEPGEVITPAKEATSKQVLVSKAVEATDPCVVTTVDKPKTPPASVPVVDQPPVELAFTGSQATPTMLLAAAFILGGFGAYRGRQRLSRG